ncbi:MAG TPA: hypothetical protein VLW65_06215 [Bryobacteraceae bacterium]|nr:hypothetical protein [Bryobacteraceae bacterium]
MTLVRLAVAFSFAALGLANAQSWDSSGNGLLTGTYYFREVAYVLQDAYGDFNDNTAIFGNITFDGKGNYTMNGTALDAAQNYFGPYTAQGTYVIAASGYGYISSPLSGTTPIPIYGLVSQQGIFVGSATETYFDLFIAAPVSSPAPTAAAFKGTYSIADLDFSSESPLDIASYLFQVSPDGAGNLPAFTINGYIAEYGSQAIPQSVSAVKYTFSNGAGVLGFPNSTNAPFVYGQKYLYISPDGNFVFGGSPQGWDMFVGVRVSGTPSFSGLYYQAGMDEDASTLPDNYVTLDTYYGALDAISGSVIEHQRQEYNDAADNAIGVTGYTFSDTFTPNSSGVYANSVMHYAVGANGAIRIGSGIGPELGLNIALAAPNVNATGVFIDPRYVVNAATFAPFTAGVSPGEFVTLAGQNLADSTYTASALPFPTTLGQNVQVKVNGLAAPLYFVTPTEISFLIPYAVTTSLASIQVISNGTASNTVTLPVNLTTPGVFTLPPGGLGTAAAQHADYSLVSSASPAQAGETIMVYVTGLGGVNPLVPDGSAAPASPLSNTSNTITAFIDGQTATVSYAGLVPYSAGLYQLNLTVPTGLASGTYTVDISGPDSYTSEATIPVGTTSTTSSQSAQTAPAVKPRFAKRKSGITHGSVPLFKAPNSR